MNRLIENGMIKAHPDMFLCWCKKDTGTVGKSSVLMKTVAMNGRLDGPLVSDDLLDFCLYSQMLMLDRGFSGSAPDKDGYLEDLNGYPGSKGFKEQLRQMGLHT